MAYDYHGHWDRQTGHVAPLYHHEGDTFYYFNAVLNDLNMKTLTVSISICVFYITIITVLHNINFSELLNSLLVGRRALQRQTRVGDAALRTELHFG